MNALIAGTFVFIGFYVSPLRMFPFDMGPYHFYDIFSWQDLLQMTQGIWWPLFWLAVAQSVFLSIRGQTIGKFLLGIKVVNRVDVQKTGFYRNVFLREIVFRLLVVLSFGLLGLVDIFTLFFSKKTQNSA